MNKTNLPNNLYILRRGAGLSQEEFAEKLGVSRQAVSKWERGEAYPDTDNLIAISEMFSVTIDELIRSDNINKDGDHTEDYAVDADADSDYFRVSVNDNVEVNLNGEITVNDEDGRVRVGLDHNGIVVNSEDGVKIKLGKHGIEIHDDDDDDDDDDRERKSSKLSILYKVPYPIVCVIAFLAIGFFAGGWGWAWTLFITIPVYYSLLDSIRKRRCTEFAYPVFVAFLYCLFGMLYSWWHPGWLIFVTIPIYYPIAEGIDRYIASIRKKK